MTKNLRFALVLAFGFSCSALYANSSTSPKPTSVTEVNALQQAASRKITGTVKDHTGELVIGATVSEKEKPSNGVATDIEGNFSINVTPGSTLIIRFIGFVPQEVVVAEGVTNYQINLKEDVHTLDEVVVVGYGTQRKESLTGSLNTIKSNKLADITSPSVENMLNGKAPGVYVASSGGQPGQAGKIVIRGKSTINGSTDHLWVIDGVIAGSSPGALNPDDIDNMTILKDAASTAIYGSQGANGVIVVTTKSARTGEMKINVTGKMGITNLSKGNLSMMDGAQLYDYYKSFNNQEMIAFPRWNEDLRNSNFDWWDLAQGTGFAQDYNVSISSGTDKVKSFFSAGYYNESGAVKGYDYNRFTARFKTTYTPFKWLSIKPALSGGLTDIFNAQRSVGAMYSMLPWDSAYDEDGNLVPHKSSLWVNSNSTNYMYDLQWNKSSSKSYELTGNFDFDVRFTDWLTFSSVNSYRWTGYGSNIYTDPRSINGIGVRGRIEESSSNTTRLYTNQFLTFNKSFGLHSVTGVLAYEFNSYLYRNMGAIGTGFVPGFNVLDITALPEKVRGSQSEWAVQSAFFRGNYSYDNRLMAEFSFRRDGASNFGSNAKYGNFFSVSLGWNINREKWFTATWVDLLKIRGSYGSVGNRPNSLYPQYDLYAIGMGASYNGVPGALISQVGNRNLTWERTFTTGLGVDFAVFQNRLRLSVDLYDKNTDNLLYAVPVSGITGVTSLWQNVGVVNNQGIEVSIGGDVIRTKDWLWSIDANFGHNKNKVVSLYGDKAEIIIGDGSGIAGSTNKMLRPGLDADTWYTREWAGVDPETGVGMWYKTVKQTDGTTTREKTKNYAEADEVTLGSYTPDLFGGFSTNLTWKNISLDAMFGFSIGGDTYNYSRLEYDSDGAYTDRNQMNLRSDWNRWEKAGDIATHPIASYNNKSNSNKASSRYMEDGSYLKLRSLTLAYTVALPKAHIKNMRIYLAGENLFCITNYSGVDPEIPVKDGVMIGTTLTPYPSTRKFMLGINFTF